MNCIQLFQEQVKATPERDALMFLDTGYSITFKELYDLSSAIQQQMVKAGLMEGHTILVGANLSALGLGVGVIFVEPFMPIKKIQRIIENMQPRAFIYDGLGRFWGLRVKAIRGIPHKLYLGQNIPINRQPLKVTNLPPETLGMVAFTSGTTGEPKGISRHHSYLVHQHEVLISSFHQKDAKNPDLTIFANFALSNLAQGRASIIISPRWKLKTLKKIDHLPKHLQPETLTTGPAFLLTLMGASQSSNLKSIHIGGALTDCWIMEKSFSHWEEASIQHVYGSSEAEPVATSDAREAVRKSRQKGFFQTLYLGRPVESIESQLETDTVWVTGPHVCPKYLYNEQENQSAKRSDESGNIWHRMGDRIVEEDGWWYAGRSHQSTDDFRLEQNIYSFLSHSKAIVNRTPKDSLSLVGRVGKESLVLRKAFPEIKDIHESPIIRDKRHRSRLDRSQMVAKAIGERV